VIKDSVLSPELFHGSNISFETSSTRPDITIIDEENRDVLLAEIAVPFDAHIDICYKKKFLKYNTPVPRNFIPRLPMPGHRRCDRQPRHCSPKSRARCTHDGSTSLLLEVAGEVPEHERSTGLLHRVAQEMQ